MLIISAERTVNPQSESLYESVRHLCCSGIFDGEISIGLAFFSCSQLLTSLDWVPVQDYQALWEESTV